MPFQIGNSHPIALREETLHYACNEGFSVLYLSDFHFTSRSAAVAARILQQVAACHPDLILLGGDYADSKAGIGLIAQLAASLTALAPVCAIAGNHDYFMGIGRIRAALESAAVEWIERRDLTMEIAGIPLRISGSRAAGPPPAPGMFSVLCLHKPAFDKHLGHYDLVFAGHLHGGQVVLWETAAGLFPGRIFYRWNRRAFRIGSCQCVISAGLGDTLPIRYNCPRDMILVNVKPPSSNTNPAFL